MKAEIEVPDAPAPGPYNWEVSGRPGSNGIVNVYVVDRDGRKIAAVWGKPGERNKTLALFVAAPVMRNALDDLRDLITELSDADDDNQRAIITEKIERVIQRGVDAADEAMG